MSIEKKMQNRSGRQAFVIFTLLTLLLLSFLTAGTACAEKLFQSHSPLFGVHFVTEEDGWACGRWGTIWHTTDGGETWAQQSSGTTLTLSSIYFVDKQTGWTVGNGGTILHTADGGATWTPQESPVEFFHMDVKFVNQQEGWIASEETHILHTIDAGRTWEVQFSDEVYRLKSISFADANHGWAVGEYGFVYGTQDGGKTWNHQAGKWDFNEDTGEIETGVFLFEVVALDADTALAVGADGVVTRTEDGGKTWSNLDHGFSPVRFYSAAKGEKDLLVIGGEGVFLFSEDRGDSWKPIRFDPDMQYGWIYGFAHLKGERFAAVGEEGRIFLGDKSEIWQRVSY